uniref:Uncharacterized protein n=1 Tax=Rhabditophanes sp. KR3021 TaxID=114890 RepID=A0AC35U9C7_9BILA
MVGTTIVMDTFYETIDIPLIEPMPMYLLLGIIFSFSICLILLYGICITVFLRDSDNEQSRRKKNLVLPSYLIPPENVVRTSNVITVPTWSSRSSLETHHPRKPIRTVAACLRQVEARKKAEKAAREWRCEQRRINGSSTPLNVSLVPPLPLNEVTLKQYQIDENRSIFSDSDVYEPSVLSTIVGASSMNNAMPSYVYHNRSFQMPTSSTVYYNI